MFPAQEGIRVLAHSAQDSLLIEKVRCLFEKSFLRAAGSTVGDAAQIVDLRGRAWICGLIDFSALGWRASSHRSTTLYLKHLDRLGVGKSAPISRSSDLVSMR
jgi:hypothetical protein